MMDVVLYFKGCGLSDTDAKWGCKWMDAAAAVTSL